MLKCRCSLKQLLCTSFHNLELLCRNKRVDIYCVGRAKLALLLSGSQSLELYTAPLEFSADYHSTRHKVSVLVVVVSLECISSIDD